MPGPKGYADCSKMHGLIGPSVTHSEIDHHIIRFCKAPRAVRWQTLAFPAGKMMATVSFRSQLNLCGETVRPFHF